MRRTAATATAWLLLGVTATTQPAEPEDDLVQVDALRCWRDVRRQAVRVGEPFTMTITCGVVETDAATTVPNEVALAPETIDLSPFEVIEGQRFPDVRDGPWRFFQYHYTLRVVAEDVFGQDVEIPELELLYHVERSLDGGAALPGRELRYILPAEPVRVLSLVPDTARDIREQPGETFGAADARLFRANLAILLAAAIGFVALGCLFAAGVRLQRRWRGAAPRGQRRVSDGVVVRRALGELTAVQQTARKRGWNDDDAGRVLTAFRLASAAALSVPIAQQRVAPGLPAREGQLRVTQGVIRQRTTALSSAVTVDAIDAAIARRRASGSTDANLGQLHDLQSVLRLFTRARYSPNGSAPGERLTSELDKGIGVVRQLRLRTFAPVQQAVRLVDDARSWWTRRWAR